jgi:hypothetical protein
MSGLASLGYPAVMRIAIILVLGLFGSAADMGFGCCGSSPAPRPPIADAGADAGGDADASMAGD